MAKKELLYELFLRLGDDRLILGHRLSEWCGHGPALEEDIALTNIALDLTGQANFFLQHAAMISDNVKSEDDLAFLRDAREFRNIQLTEQPNGDFAFTIARQFFFDVFSYHLMDYLKDVPESAVNELAERFIKEDTYHLRHSREWILRLGGGTEESNRRLQNAVDELWIFTGEMFEEDDITKLLKDEGLYPGSDEHKKKWNDIVLPTLKEVGIKIPEGDYTISGGRRGIHSEHLGHLLAVMQILPRTYPDAKW